MLKDKLFVFVLKRLFIYCILISITDIIFIGQKWHVLIGLFLGGVLSILRFGSYSLVFKGLIPVENQVAQKNHYASKNVFVFIANQIILIPLLFLAIKYNLYFFIGVVEGILLVPLVIFINSFTEAFSITHNNFE